MNQELNKIYERLHEILSGTKFADDGDVSTLEKIGRQVTTFEPKFRELATQNRAKEDSLKTILRNQTSASTYMPQGQKPLKESIDFQEMTIKALKDFASGMGIDISTRRKSDIIDEIKAGIKE